MRKQQTSIKVKNEELEKEMKECTFKPRLYSRETKEGKNLSERVGDRSMRS